MLTCQHIKNMGKYIRVLNFMKKYAYLITSLSLLLVFIVFTILVKTVDVQYIYNNTYLGFYHANYEFGNWAVNFGKYEGLRKISDIIFYISFGYSGLLGVFGIISWIRNKKLKNVNKQYFVLLGGYVSIVITYFIFEIVKINYSPDSSLNNLHASYPSSHVFIGCALVLLNSYSAIKLLNPHKKWLIWLIYGATGLICLMLTFSRLMSLKHWMTDVIASVILVSVIYTLFIYVSQQFNKVNEGETQEIE